MKTETIVMCVVALILGMLMANMLKSVCGCKSTVVEGQHNEKYRECARGCHNKYPNDTHPHTDIRNCMDDCMSVPHVEHH